MLPKRADRGRRCRRCCCDEPDDDKSPPRNNDGVLLVLLELLCVFVRTVTEIVSIESGQRVVVGEWQLEKAWV